MWGKHPNKWQILNFTYASINWLGSINQLINLTLILQWPPDNTSNIKCEENTPYLNNKKSQTNWTIDRFWTSLKCQSIDWLTWWTRISTNCLIDAFDWQSQTAVPTQINSTQHDAIPLSLKHWSIDWLTWQITIGNDWWTMISIDQLIDAFNGRQSQITAATQISLCLHNQEGKFACWKWKLDQSWGSWQIFRRNTKTWMNDNKKHWSIDQLTYCIKAFKWWKQSIDW